MTAQDTSTVTSEPTPSGSLGRGTGSGPASGPKVRYLARRETHSSRAITAIIVALIATAALAYLVVEAVLSLIGQDPLLLRPSTALDWVATLPEQVQLLIPAAGVAIGVGIALIGLWLVWKAIAPGALSRHVIADDRAAVVIDDSVLAASISRHTREAMALPDGQAATSLGRRSATIKVTPTSGKPIVGQTVEERIQPVVDTWGLQPAIRVRADVSESGVVGS